MSVPTILHPRADMVALFCTQRRPDAPQLRPGQSTIVDPVSDDKVRYWIEGKDSPGGKEGTCLTFSNIRIASPVALEVIATRKENPQRTNSEWQDYTNETDAIQDVSFSSTFSEVQSKEKSFVESLTVGMEEEVGTGAESPVTASFKFSQQLQTTFGQTFGESKTYTKEFSRTIHVPPCSKVEVRAYREITDVEEDVQGYGDFTHDIGLCSWYHGGFGGKFHCHYNATFTWDQFKRIVTGEVLPYNFSHEFQQNPLSAEDQHRLFAPLTTAKLKQTLKFQNVDHEDVEIKQTILGRKEVKP